MWRINVHVNHEISCARLCLSISAARRNGRPKIRRKEDVRGCFGVRSVVSDRGLYKRSTWRLAIRAQNWSGEAQWARWPGYEAEGSTRMGNEWVKGSWDLGTADNFHYLCPVGEITHPAPEKARN